MLGVGPYWAAVRSFALTPKSERRNCEGIPAAEVEATTGFEPVNRGFAWPPPRAYSCILSAIAAGLAKDAEQSAQMRLPNLEVLYALPGV